MQCDLEVFLDGRLVRRVQLGADAIHIGREPTNEVILPGAAVAETHARVMSKGDRYILTDLSARGTYMRGHRVITSQIAVGDEFYIGPYVFRVVSRDYPVHESAMHPPPAPPESVIRAAQEAAAEAARAAVPPPAGAPSLPASRTSGPQKAPSVTSGPQRAPVLPGVPVPPMREPGATDSGVLRRRSGKSPVLPPPPPPIDLSGLIGVIEVRPLLEALLHDVMPVFRASRGVVMLVDGGALSPVVARHGASSPVQESFSRSVCRRAVESRVAVLIPGGDVFEPDEDLAELAEGCPAALMALPLESGDRCVGVLYLECDGQTPPAWHDRPTLDAVRRFGGRALAAALEHEMLAHEALRTKEQDGARKRIRPLAEVVAEREREHIEAMLKRSEWDLADAARLLGISRQTLQSRLRKLGIRGPS